MTTPLSYNPYDFANPVSDEHLFVGRRSELSDIEYYLNQASAAPRAINIALLGPRAAGKTSLLNMIAKRASRMGMCVARIDLNESDVESPLGFFLKVFDSALSAVCDHEYVASDGTPVQCFGGPRGRTYQTYLDIVNAYRVPADLTFCPFLFPVQYGKAMAANVADARVSDHILRKDFAALAEEAGVPIALLFDECNVLGGSRSLLEMLRNVFMNTKGYFLVFTGTPDLFPVMDDVFSPIVRQFKKIAVKELTDRNETFECIAAPLRGVGLNHVIASIDKNTVAEIEQITGKRPYEIQLLCHVMFRAMQRGASDRMALSVEVLDSVLAELSQGKDISQRPTLSALRALTTSELNLASRLLACGSTVTYEQFWYTQRLSGAPDESRTETFQLIAKLKSVGLLEDADTIKFAGDDFDRIYSKYYAKKRGVDLSFAEMPFQVLVGLSIAEAVPRLVGFMTGRLGEEDSPAGEEVAAAISDPRVLIRLFELYPRDALSVYLMLADNVRAELKTVRIISCDVTSPWSRHRFTFVMPGDSRESLDENSPLLEMSARAKELGGSIVVSFHSVALPSLPEVVSRVTAHASDALRRRLAGRHFNRMTYEYLNGNPAAARWNGDVGIALSPMPEVVNATNYAYVLSGCGDYVGARRVLELIPDLADQAGLPLYNMAVLDCIAGDYEAASRRFNEVVRCVNEKSDGRYDCACLLVPYADESGVVISEERDVELGRTAARAASALSSLPAGTGPARRLVSPPWIPPAVTQLPERADSDVVVPPPDWRCPECGEHVAPQRHDGQYWCLGQHPFSSTREPDDSEDAEQPR